MDDNHHVQQPERYELRLWIEGGDPGWQYQEEHWFVERPEREVILMLWEDAKATFAALYPGREPTDFSVWVKRLRPVDLGPATLVTWRQEADDG